MANDSMTDDRPRIQRKLSEIAICLRHSSFAIPGQSPHSMTIRRSAALLGNRRSTRCDASSQAQESFASGLASSMTFRGAARKPMRNRASLPSGPWARNRRNPSFVLVRSSVLHVDARTRGNRSRARSTSYSRQRRPAVNLTEQDRPADRDTQEDGTAVTSGVIAAVFHGHGASRAERVYRG